MRSRHDMSGVQNIYKDSIPDSVRNAKTTNEVVKVLTREKSKEI